MTYSLIYKYIILSSLLWKVDSAIYLFGTSHVLCLSDTSFIQQLNPYISLCDTIYLETIDTLSPENIPELYNLSTNNRSYFTSEQYSKLCTSYPEVAQNPNIDIHFLSFLSSDSMPCPSFDLEPYISKRWDKPRKGFETMSEGLAHIKSEPAADVVARIMLPNEDISDLLSLYRQQRIIDIYLSIQNKELFINSRNRKWATTIHSLHGKYFIAVGAAHLPTLILMLRGMGHRVEPISLK